LDPLEDRCLLSAGYFQVNLVSDVPGLARVADPNLINPWGLSFSPTGPFWLAENGAGVSDLLDGRGQVLSLVVNVPTSAGASGTPTGTVFNPGHGFIVTANGVSASSQFLFAATDGTITGWAPSADRTNAVVAVDNASAGADYTGLALATDAGGHSFLYAADIGRGTIDVFDDHFQQVANPHSFLDPSLPAGYVPFNVQNVGNLLYVTYALRDPSGPGDLPGAGHGIIDAYAFDGALVNRIASGGTLNSPWGIALAPAGFGPFGGALLVGNNGDGHINAFNPASGAFLGQLADDSGSPIEIPNLWALAFGNGHQGGAADTLFFVSGPGDEHGLFGAIQSPQGKGADTGGLGSFDPKARGERPDYPLPPSGGPALPNGAGQTITVAVLMPLADSSLALAPTLTTSTRPPARGDTTALTALPPCGLVATTALVPGAATLPAPGDTRPSPGTVPILPAALTSVLIPALGDFSPSLSEGDATFVGLNAFLDVNSFSMAARGRVETQQPESLEMPGVGVVERSADTAGLLVRGPSFVGSEVRQLEVQDLAVSSTVPRTAISDGRSGLEEAQGLAAHIEGSTLPTGQERPGWPAWVTNVLLVLSAPLFWCAVKKRPNLSERIVVRLAALRSDKTCPST
jgi:uncharacterized protein (TIGR03118 family)